MPALLVRLNMAAFGTWAVVFIKVFTTKIIFHWCSFFFQNQKWLVVVMSFDVFFPLYQITQLVPLCSLSPARQQSHKFSFTFANTRIIHQIYNKVWLILIVCFCDSLPLSNKTENRIHILTNCFINKVTITVYPQKMTHLQL